MKPQTVPNEMQVHNLEDGGVMIQYREDQLSKEQIEALDRDWKDSGS